MSYNGWTNYETWRVNLEMFDGFDPEEYFARKPELGDLMDWAQNYVTEYVEMTIPETPSSNIAHGWIAAFLSEVNWAEIARHWMDDHWQEEEEEEEFA
jgi:hypothetical protein